MSKDEKITHRPAYDKSDYAKGGNGPEDTPKFLNETSTVSREAWDNLAPSSIPPQEPDKPWSEAIYGPRLRIKRGLKWRATIKTTVTHEVFIEEGDIDDTIEAYIKEAERMNVRVTEVRLERAKG